MNKEKSFHKIKNNNKLKMFSFFFKNEENKKLDPTTT